MPIFEYYCWECKRKKDYLVLGKEERPKSIPCECGKQMEKVFSPPAVHFLGGGWTEKGFQSEREKSDEDVRDFHNLNEA